MTNENHRNGLQMATESKKGHKLISCTLYRKDYRTREGYDCFIKLISSRAMCVCDSAKILSIKKVKKANTKHIDISSQGTCHIFTPKSVFCFVEGEHRRR